MLFGFELPSNNVGNSMTIAAAIALLRLDTRESAATEIQRVWRGFTERCLRIRFGNTVHAVYYRICTQIDCSSDDYQIGDRFSI